MSENAQPAAEQTPAFSVYPPDEAPSAPPSAPPEQASDAGTDEPDISAEDAGAEPESEAKKPRGGFQKRISELTAKAHQAEREAQYWREQAQRSAQPAPVQQPQQQATAPAEATLPPDLAQWVGAAPKPTDFAAGEFDPAYIIAAAKHDMRADAAKQEVQRRAVQQQQAHQSFAQRVSSLLEATEREAEGALSILTAHDFPMPEHVLRNVVECEKPEVVLAYMARNPAEAARIAQLRSPTAVARELGRLEARLTAPPPPAPTAAPPPPPTVRGRAAAPRSIYDVGEDTTPDQYRRLRYG